MIRIILQQIMNFKRTTSRTMDLSILDKIDYFLSFFFFFGQISTFIEFCERITGLNCGFVVKTDFQGPPVPNIKFFFKNFFEKYDPDSPGLKLFKELFHGYGPLNPGQNNRFFKDQTVNFLNFFFFFSLFYS